MLYYQTRRTYIHCQDGKLYRLNVGVSECDKEEKPEFACKMCMLHRNFNCVSKGFADNTCCDCGRGYVAWWAYEYPPQYYVNSSSIARYLDQFVTTRKITPHFITSFAKRHTVSKQLDSHCRWEYNVSEIMIELWKAGYFETTVNNLNTRFRTDEK